MMPTLVTLAVDVGGTKIAYGLVDANGAVLAAHSFASDAARPYADDLATLRDGLRRLLAQHPQASAAGVGVGCTGPVDWASGRLGVNNFLPHWEGTRPAADLGETFGVPAYADNDANAAALGEVRWGAGRGSTRCLFLTISTGIGGALVLDGTLYRGAGGIHPEIGHHIIDPSGPLCFCGARGCWESLASGTALARRYAETGASPLTAAQICQRAQQYDPTACQVVAQTGEALGWGIVNITTLFAPDVIVLGGGMMQSWGLFEPSVRSALAQAAKLVPHDNLILRRAALGIHAGLVGAAALVQAVA